MADHKVDIKNYCPQLRVFRPFFVSLDLPYNVIRGEVFAIPVVVFNYMERDVSVIVSLDNSEGVFEIPDMSNDIDAPKGKQLFS